MKLSLRYGKDALYQHTVETWIAHFQSGRAFMEDDDRLGRSSRDNFSIAISGSLERNPHASCREIGKDLFVSITTISRGLEKIDSRFFIGR
jgi:hypothetical protein